MAQCLNFLLFDNPQEMPPIIKKKYSSIKLKLFEFIEIFDAGPGVTEIQTNLVYEENNIEHEKSICFRLHNLSKEGLCVRGELNSTWVLINWNDV